MQKAQPIRLSAARFGIVGILNTVIDFGITNALFFLLQPSTTTQLALIAVAAFSAAAANSYFLNSRWSFSGQSQGPRVAGRFILATALGMALSTAVFLFMMRYLPLVAEMPSLALLNAARLCSVISAVAINFLSYRIWVFKDARQQQAREALPGTELPEGAWKWLSGILALGLLARLWFVWAAPVAYGDAINYSWVAWFIGHGQASVADSFWHSLFDFWQAGLVAAGLGQYAALVLASLVPGLLLVAIVFDLTRRLYGYTAARIAGIIAALHPRLVEYSVNGYAETFYLCCAVLALWGICTLWNKPRNLLAIIAAGLGLAGWILVRNEAIVFAGVAMLTGLYLGRDRIADLGPACIKVGLICLAIIVAYAAANEMIWQDHGLLRKSTNLGRQHVEMLDPQAAARETYGLAEMPVQPPEPALQRWTRNLRYTAERLPGMILSPFFLVALLLPLVYPRREPARDPAWPLLLFSAWPLLFYPFMQLEPRMLFPTLVGAIVFSAAALMPAGRWLNAVFSRSRSDSLRRAPTAAMLISLLVVLPLLASHSMKTRGYHRQVGEWLKTHMPAEVALSGDGYGYVTASAFWAGRRAEPRPWTDNPGDLGQATLASGSALVLYEDYLKRFNPELLPSLNTGMPGLILAHEFQFPDSGRVQVWLPPGKSLQ